MRAVVACVCVFLLVSTVAIAHDHHDHHDHHHDDHHHEPLHENDLTPDDQYVVLEPASSLFHETFQGVNWQSRWVVSEDESFDGEWNVEKGNTEYAVPQEKGLIIKTPAKKHAISALFPSVIEMVDEDLVVQYEVRFNKILECGGAYLKLVRNTDDMFTPEEFGSKTDYVIMFGPDKCGATNKVHFIFKHQNPVSGEYIEHHLKNPPSVTVDPLTHLYTLIVKKDNTFEIFIDQKSVSRGNLLNDFEPPVNPPKLIDDPADFKPSDWVDEAKIPDATATKPDDWDEEAPRLIPDPDAKKPEGWLDDAPAQIPDPASIKPEDWDEELDGDWEAPLIDNPACDAVGCGEWVPPTIKNPAYKGKWSAPLIDNPAYKGEWKPKQIENPNYFVDEHPHNLSPMVAIGFELWTMQEGIQFDNIYIGRDPRDAHAWAQKTYVYKRDVENSKKKAEEKQKKFEKMESQKQQGFTGKLQAYSELAGDFVSEHPVPIFFTVVALLVGMVVFFEYRRPKTSDEDELQPEEAAELLNKLKDKLRAEGKLTEEHKEEKEIVAEGAKDKSD